MNEDTILVADATPTEHVELAWSAEDDDVVDNNALADDTENLAGQPRRRRWPAWIALAWLCATFGALGFSLYGDQPAHVSSPPAASTPASAPVKPPAPPAPPLVIPPSPPARHEKPPPPPAPPANVNAATMARFHSLLADDGMTDSESQHDFDPLAQRVCSDAAAGALHPPTQYFHSEQSPGHSAPPPHAAALATRDTIRAFCPQYLPQ